MSHRAQGVLLLSTVLALFSFSAVAAQTILPPPAPGSFGSQFDFTRDGQTFMAFNGSQVLVESTPGSSDFTVIGELPAAFQGGADPGLGLTSPFGHFFLLGSGAGGTQFPDPFFNGNIFIMPRTGGTAHLVANIPFSDGAAFWTPFRVFVNSGVDTFDSFTIVHLNLLTGRTRTVIAGDGATGGVGVDRRGNLFISIGFDANGRTGEVRKFTRRALIRAILRNEVIDFDDGEFIIQLLSGTGLHFDRDGDMWIAGGDLIGGASAGFFAEVDPKTGNIRRKLDPSDGDPDAGPVVFWALQLNQPFGCTIGAINLADAVREVVLVDACE